MHFTRLISSAVAGLLVASACSKQATPTKTPPERAHGASASDSSKQTAIVEATGKPARLTLVVVLDQLPSWALSKLLPYLEEDGLIRRAVSQGVYYERSLFNYAGTYTAAGHATIHTGLPPAVNGVYSNETYDAKLKRTVPTAQDVEYPTFGSDDAPVSPALLQVETVGDALKRQTDGRAKALAISVKDRAAVFSAGKRPDIAIWYDKRAGRFTTSQYYVDALPRWLDRHQHEKPLLNTLRVWKPRDPQLLLRVQGVDDQPGEGDWLGYGKVFPHDVAASNNPASVVRASPFISEYMIDLAGVAVKEYELGNDDVPDLLTLSISSTDYVGHVFGANSWEYLENLIVVDELLGAFVRDLEQQANLSVVITSDHGVAPVPEAAQGGGGRIIPDELVQTLNQRVAEKLGHGEWVEAYVSPFLYLSAAARAESDKVVPIIVAAATALDAVHLAADTTTVRGWSKDDGSLKALVSRSVPKNAPGDVIIVPARHHIVDPGMAKNAGTSHGSPWDYDREVPLLLVGHGIEGSGILRGPTEQARVAPTIAKLLSIEPPVGVSARPLPE